jgi:hypothetical protein
MQATVSPPGEAPSCTVLYLLTTAGLVCCVAYCVLVTCVYPSCCWSGVCILYTLVVGSDHHYKGGMVKTVPAHSLGQHLLQRVSSTLTLVR